MPRLSRPSSFLSLRREGEADELEAELSAEGAGVRVYTKSALLFGLTAAYEQKG